MEKKLIGLILCLFCLLGCNKKEDKSLSFASGLVTRVQNNTVCVNVNVSIPSATKKTEFVKHEFSIDDNTLFLNNGRIVSKQNIKPGTQILFSTEKNTLILVEIENSNS